MQMNTTTQNILLGLVFILWIVLVNVGVFEWKMTITESVHDALLRLAHADGESHANGESHADGESRPVKQQIAMPQLPICQKPLPTPLLNVTQNVTQTAQLPNPWQDPSRAAQNAQDMAWQCEATVRERRWIANGNKSLHWDTIRLIDERTPTIEWPGFSPSRDVLQNQHPTDLRRHIVENPLFWNRTFAFDLDRNNDTEADSFLEVQLNLNEMHFVLNPELASRIQPNHLPIVLPVFKRTEPLRTALKALCADVNAISETKMILSIDHTGFEAMLHVVLEELTCVYTHVVWHPFLIDKRQWNLNDHQKMTAHFAYVLYMAIHQLNYSYAILFEDDLLPGPDYYQYHLGVWDQTILNFDITSVSSYSHGPRHDCQYLRDKLLHTGGDCMANAADQLFTDTYFVGWGAGIPRHTFYDIMHIWHRDSSMVWDGAILEIQMYRGGYTIVPCMPRVRYLPNIGLHGIGYERWELGLRQDALVHNKTTIPRFCLLP